MKINRSLIIGFIFGIVFTSIGVVAANIKNASEITYGDNNVEAALNDLYKETSNKSNIYNLGQGTSFNIKELYPDIDYTKLTNDNFIVGLKNLPSGSTGSSDPGDYSYASEAGISIVVSYNNESGILSITGNNLTIKHQKVQAGWVLSTKVITFQPFVYMVLGNIN